MRACVRAWVCACVRALWGRVSLSTSAQPFLLRCSPLENIVSLRRLVPRHCYSARDPIPSLENVSGYLRHNSVNYDFVGWFSVDSNERSCDSTLPPLGKLLFDAPPVMYRYVTRVECIYTHVRVYIPIARSLCYYSRIRLLFQSIISNKCKERWKLLANFQFGYHLSFPSLRITIWLLHYHLISCASFFAPRNFDYSSRAFYTSSWHDYGKSGTGWW